MNVRKYKPSDCNELSNLFYDTVHNINAKDYTQVQLDVWATGNVNLENWNKSFLEHYTFVAVEAEKIVGFGDIDRSGYLDRLYVHKNYQGLGIATALCNRLENKVTGRITVHASITAKPFFEKRGYGVLREQQIKRQGITLINFVMEKVIK